MKVDKDESKLLWSPHCKALYNTYQSSCDELSYFVGGKDKSLTAKKCPPLYSDTYGYDLVTLRNLPKQTLQKLLQDVDIDFMGIIDQNDLALEVYDAIERPKLEQHIQDRNQHFGFLQPCAEAILC